MIKNFKQFSSLLSINEAANVTFNDLERIDNMQTLQYLRDVMWDKSIKLFYGKDYKGNPEKDNRVLRSSLQSNPNGVSYGELFKDAWEETDDFCKKAAWQYGVWFGDKTFNSRIEKEITYMEPDTVLEWINSTGIKVSTSDPTTFVVPTDINDSAKKIGGAALEFFSKKTIKLSDSSVSTVVGRLADRNKYLNIIKKVMEEQTDFDKNPKADWGLDDYWNYLPEMPGWGKFYKVEADKLGYWFTSNIANATMDFAEINFGVAVLKGIQTMIGQKLLTVQDINSGSTTSNSVTPTPPTSTKPGPAKPAVPKQAPKGGVKKGKDPNFV